MARPSGAGEARAQIIRTYGEGGLEVGGVRHRGSVLILPGRTVPWAVGSVSAMTLESLAPATALAGQIDILIIGCGGRGPAPPAGLQGRLRALGIASEFMDTGAACRTFNLLLSENRRVAAALIALD